MKQTLEAPFDPGALRISGPNVLFTSVDQFLSRTSGIAHGDNFEFLIEISREYSVRLSFSRHAREGVQLDEMEYAGDGEHLILRPDMNESALEGALENSKEFASFRKFYTEKIAESLQLQVRRNRFWLEIGVLPRSNGEGLRFGLSPAGVVPNCIGRIIHVPGLRGNPERTYRTTAVAGEFPGLFNDYVASVVHFWKLRGDQRLALLGKHLKRLGLTWKVETRQVDDTRVEVRVGRLPQASRGGARDMVSIADVGFGVSQTLPVVVALLAAEPGQLVYLEQPEIHLHPRAQVHLAELMVAAANRGVRLIVETHSSLLILSLQALVAEGKISSKNLILHWFTRRTQDGATNISSADLDQQGAYGDWPIDFGDIELDLQSRYLDLAENRRPVSAQRHGS